MIRASAGGCMKNVLKICHKRKISESKLKELISTTKKKSPLLSPTTNTSFMVGSSNDSSCYIDLSDRLEKWRVKRKESLINGHLLIKSSDTTLKLTSQLDGELSRATELSRASSCNSLSERSSTTDESQKEITNDSDVDLCESGYITNCEYYISNSRCSDSIEEQHNLQATVADYWILTQGEYFPQIPVIYDFEDNYWYFHQWATNSRTEGIYEKNKSSNKIIKLSETDATLSSSQFLEYFPDEGTVVEAIPSALMLYRLECFYFKKILCYLLFFMI